MGIIATPGHTKDIAEEGEGSEKPNGFERCLDNGS